MGDGQKLNAEKEASIANIFELLNKELSNHTDSAEICNKKLIIPVNLTITTDFEKLVIFASASLEL